jgi:hypothetical protein
MSLSFTPVAVLVHMATLDRCLSTEKYHISDYCRKLGLQMKRTCTHHNSNVTCRIMDASAHFSLLESVIGESTFSSS